MKFDPEILERVSPLWKKENYDRFTDEEREKWLRLRDRALTDWFFLANDLLGYYFQPDVHTELFAQFPQFDPASNKHFYQLSEQIKKILVLWSRGTFKTTAVQVLIIAALLYDPDLIVMIISGSDKLAKRLLKAVKSHFELPNPKFKKLFPEFCHPKLGNMSEFTLPCRVNAHTGEPSVSISSSKAAKAGLHPDLLIVDDLVHEQNYRSAQLLEKCWEEFQMFEPLVNPGGMTIVTGTRWSFGDTHQLIQELAQKENIQFGKSIWRISIKSCWKNDDKAQGPIFPEHTIVYRGVEKIIGNSVDFLEHKLLSMGQELFCCQYLNSPISSATQTFTDALLDQQTFHWLKPPADDFSGPYLPQNGVDFIVGDLAFVGSEKRDSTVFYVVRLWNGQLWVYDCIEGVWGSETLVVSLWNLIFQIRPQVVFIEKIPAWDSYDYSFRGYANQHGIQRYPVQWVQLGSHLDAKKIRIGGLQAAFSQKRLWMYSGMPAFQELKTQLKRFPKLGKHDDHADCLAIILMCPTSWWSSGQMYQTGVPEMLKKAREDDPTIQKPGACGSVITCG